MTDGASSRAPATIEQENFSRFPLFLGKEDTEGGGVRQSPYILG
jgi:hypothetical protein